MENSKTTPSMKAEANSNVKTRKPRATKAITVSPVHEKISKLETAYMAAISGEMKFGEVKSIFKQLHKEIKKSVKSKN